MYTELQYYICLSISAIIGFLLALFFHLRKARIMRGHHYVLSDEPYIPSQKVARQWQDMVLAHYPISNHKPYDSQWITDTTKDKYTRVALNPMNTDWYEAIILAARNVGVRLYIVPEDMAQDFEDSPIAPLDIPFYKYGEDATCVDCFEFAPKKRGFIPSTAEDIGWSYK